ncbi:hypothetical protein Pcinc_035559 [Petrolisthes cinctipes]|uniref:Uncharacterized protein n=1 Tax=Petrolisthes cinctipes TaxID=88211 RepID=A0AAE1EPC5_PETCI|nr:hypothetical protein Pcinc_035559 [Petrolisthes cinctipes]
MHAGLVSVSDGKSRPQPMKLILTSDSLVLQKEQLVISTSVPDTNGPDTRGELLVRGNKSIEVSFHHHDNHTQPRRFWGDRKERGTGDVDNGSEERGRRKGEGTGWKIGRRGEEEGDRSCG